jgi:hypothetical protein
MGGVCNDTKVLEVCIYKGSRALLAVSLPIFYIWTQHKDASKNLISLIIDTV